MSDLPRERGTRARANDERAQDQTLREDDGAPTPEPPSYMMLDPRFREIYFRFYKETSKPSALDRKTKELVAIGVNAAAIVDLTDIAARNTQIQLFDPEKGRTAV
jgi:alkylhydroperoxidase/carboxymuconolactone decarboxylase family protein YurZ